MPRRKPHRAIILEGGPEDGYVELVPADLDEVTVTTKHEGQPIHEYTYARTNRFSARRRVFELVCVLNARGRTRSEP